MKPRILVALMVGTSTIAAGPAASLAQEEITLRWQTTALTESQFEPVWKQIVAEFEAAHPNVSIEPVMVARQDHWTKFVTAAQARMAPCIASVDVPTAAYAGYLMPLDEFWAEEPESYKNVWSDDALAAVRYEGSLYGLPWYAGIYGEIYNRELVEQAGLDPENLPETWEEYLAWAEKLTGEDHWATAILGGPTSTTTRVLLSWIYSNGGRAFSEDMTEATFAKDPKSLEAIKFYLGLASEHGVTAPGAATINYLEQTNLFAQGKIATMRNAYWSMAKVIGDNPEMEGNMLVAFPPANSPDAKTVAKITAVSVSSNCEHPAMAWEFIKFMNEPKWAMMMVNAANWMPMRNDLLKDPEILANPVVAKFLEIGSIARTIPLPHPAWEDIVSNDVVDAVQRALLEPERTEEIFRELDEIVTRKLNDV